MTLEIALIIGGVIYLIVALFTFSQLSVYSFTNFRGFFWILLLSIFWPIAIYQTWKSYKRG